MPLSPKAIDLLYLLVARAPAIVTKEEIFDAVWPGTFVVESSLARNVSLIRKALEERGGAGPFIETIPKRGYRFVAATGPTREPPVQPTLETTATPVARSAAQASQGPPVKWRMRLAWAAGAALLVSGIWWMRASRQTEENAAERIGQYLLSKGTPGDALTALQWYERAISEKPDSAGAHGGLAQTLIVLQQLSAGGAPEFERAQREAQTALRLDPRNAAAHAAMGATHLFVDWDLVGAERSLKRALSLDANYINAYVFQGMLMSWTGRQDEAMTLMLRARHLDPVSPMIGMQVGRLYYERGRWEPAAAEFRSVLERESHFGLAHYYLALTYGFLGRYEEAYRHLAAAELHPGVLRTDQAWLRLRQGDPRPAREVYAELKRAVEEGKLGPSTVLLLAVALGDLDRAFVAADSSVRERSTALLSIRTDPRLAPLRADPRYRDFERGVEAMLAAGNAKGMAR